MDYVLYYWGIPFRGNFLLLMLEDVGASYEHRNSRELYPQRRLSVRHPGMAPPFLYERSTNAHFNQMPACLMHLARANDRLPGDAVGDTLALKVILDCDDVLMEITRHNGMMMWERDAWMKFRTDRLATWMRIFEGVGRHHGLTPGAGFMLGENVSVADLATTALFGTMVHSFPQLAEDLETHLRELSDPMGLLAQDRARIIIKHC